MAKTGASEEVQVVIGGDASSLQEATDTAVESLTNVQAAAGLAGAALGALAVGGLAKATQSAAAFEEQMVEVEKVTNPETAEEMGTAIRDMAAEMPVAQSELAGITAQAGRFGIEGSENIRQFTETVAQMSVATDLSTEQAGESFARLSTQMDEPIEKVDDMGNVINELSNTMATSSSEITDSALRSSGVLSQMGASSEDILALNAAMNEASESSERAGTRLRRMAQEIQDPAKVEDLAAALGMSVDEFERMREEDPTALFEEMAETMGEGDEQADALRETLSTTSQQALTGLSQNMEGLAEAQETANEQVEDGTSLQEEYESASSTFNSELQITKNRLRNVAIQIGQNLLPAVSGVLQYVNRAISAFSSLNSESDGMIGTVGLVATALGGFAVAASSAVAAAGGMTAVLGAVGSALTVLTGPVGIAIAAIALLTGAWKADMGNIQSHTKRVLSFVQNLIRTTLTRIRTWWSQNGKQIVQTAKSAFNTVKNTIKGVLMFVWKQLVKPILTSIQQFWKQHGKALMGETKQTFNSIMGHIKTVLGFLWNNIIKPILAVIQTAWSKWGDEIMTVVEAVFGYVDLIITQNIDHIVTTIRVALALLRGDWGEAWDLIAGFFERTWDRITSFLSNDAVPALLAALTILVEGALDVLDYLIGTEEGTLYDDVAGVLDSLASWITDSATSLFSAAFGALAEAAKEAFRYLTGTGRDTLVGDMKQTIADAIGWVNDQLPDELEFEFSIDIPSEEIGGQNVPGTDRELPEVTVGGGSIGMDESVNLPQLDAPRLNTGGMIEEAGMAMLHAGEEVVPKAEVDRDREERGGVSGEMDVSDDVARGMSKADRTDDLIREQQQTRRVISELADALDVDITVEQEPGRYAYR
ncbi:phage tail tape measure protein [Halostella sp. PRR32]|uniref:phage tail tape measure protein n=1 Tax=Halostella sp. PRR32 TaxID=3098147 RepID=UPI002B1D8207|nr:phage tail tape measure protein [Halostella sp. PRR32]